jgi:hypothetical protein
MDLSPDRFAQVNIVFIGQRATGCADSTANQRAVHSTAAGKGARCCTDAGTDTAAREGTVRFAFAAGGQQQGHGGDGEDDFSSMHGILLILVFYVGLGFKMRPLSSGIDAKGAVRCQPGVNSYARVEKKRRLKSPRFIFYLLPI